MVGRVHPKNCGYLAIFVHQQGKKCKNNCYRQFVEWINIFSGGEKEMFLFGILY